MGRWDIQENEISLHFENTVNDTVVAKVQEALESGKEIVYVSFNVTGRTCHQLLSHQLKERLVSLYGPKVDVQIGYNYECTIKRLASDDTSVKRLADNSMAAEKATNSNGAKDLDASGSEVPKDLERFSQRMYGEYLCSCGCGEALIGKCYGVGEGSDDEGYRWRCFTEKCWERVSKMTDAAIYSTTKEAQ